jgi:hypothetical protein
MKRLCLFLLLLILSSPLQGQSSGLSAPGRDHMYASDTDAVNLMVATTIAPVPQTSYTGLELRILTPNANTFTTPTSNVNGTGGKTITRNGHVALVADDLNTTAVASLLYQAMNAQLRTPQVHGWRLVQAPTQAAGLVANVAATTIYTTPAVAGHYRVCVNEELTRPATTKAMMPWVQIVYTSSLDSVGRVSTIIQSNAQNARFYSASGCTGPLFTAASTKIQYQTGNYASVGATTLQYALSFSVETE